MDQAVTEKVEQSVASRRLADLLLEMQFLEVQWQVLREEAGPHLIRNRALRIVALDHRLDRLEKRLRLRARVLGEDELATIGQIRSRLRRLVDRRQQATHNHPGPERRVAPQRRGDVPQSLQSQDEPPA